MFFLLELFPILSTNLYSITYRSIKDEQLVLSFRDALHEKVVLRAGIEPALKSFRETCSTVELTELKLATSLLLVETYVGLTDSVFIHITIREIFEMSSDF